MFCSFPLYKQTVDCFTVNNCKGIIVWFHVLYKCLKSIKELIAKIFKKLQIIN